MEKIINLIRTIARAGVWCSGSVMLIIAILITAEVISRKAFSYHIIAADELAGYALAITTSWSISFTLLERGHIRVDALYMILPNKLKAILDIIGLFALSVFPLSLTWYAYHMLTNSWELGKVSNTAMAMPLWIPQGIWFIGLIFFALTTVVLLLRVLVLFAAGDVEQVNRLAGTRSVSSELHDEIDEITVNKQQSYSGR
ncbi:TRAP transporter small permease subunit [Fodinicurvata halophila]|uniref:TRAP transporter small permease protein n=1 Tax=Fodinicurvata halophila TaxID=1419723 RepID=A0ABV8UMZ9_9PROT